MAHPINVLFNSLPFHIVSLTNTPHASLSTHSSPYAPPCVPTVFDSYQLKDNPQTLSLCEFDDLLTAAKSPRHPILFGQFPDVVRFCSVVTTLIVCVENNNWGEYNFYLATFKDSKN